MEGVSQNLPATQTTGPVLEQPPESSRWRSVGVLALVAVAYFITGALGLELAVPPGFSTAIWPPSGIALSAVLLFGAPACGGVWLGSFAVNLWAAQYYDLHPVIWVAFAIACGSALQCYVGLRLFRYLMPGEVTLITVRDVGVLYLLVAPTSCLVASTIGVCTLWSVGAVPDSALTLNWATWWSGDLMGIGLVVPLCLSLFGKPFAIWRSRRATLAVPLLGSFIAALGLFLVVRESEQSRVQKEFEHRAEELAYFVDSAIDEYETVLISLKSFFESSKKVDILEFKSFTSSLLQRYPSLYALSWAPLITSEQRKEFESKLLSFPAKGITGLTGVNQVGPRSEQSSYVPILYAEPPEAAERVMGFDLLSEPIRHATIEKSRDDDATVMSERIELLIKGEKRAGFFLSLPIHFGEKNEKPDGFVVAVFKLSALAEQAERFAAGAATLTIDEETAAGWHTIYTSKAADRLRVGDPGASGLRSIAELSRAGRRLRLRLQATPEHFAATYSWKTFNVLAVGLLLVNMLSAFLLIVTGHNYRLARFERTLEDRVAKRTEDLLRANEGLELKREQLRIARDVAQQSSRARGEFLALMSHEIRTPMNGVIGMTDLLMETDLNPDQQELAQSVKTCATALLEIVNDILDFSKLDAGKTELHLNTFNLTEMLTQFERIYSVIAAKKRITFSLIIEPNIPPYLAGDAGRINQVLINLVGNAIKFTPPGGIVIVHVEMIDRSTDIATINFSVADSGDGIPPSKQKVIFDAFLQADSVVTRRYGGTGLGLSISDQLTRLMGGAISVRSIQGVGSRFEFNIPLRISANPGVAPEADRGTEAFDPREKADGKILVVDDNHVNQELVRRILERRGYTVTVAHDGRRAIELINKEEFDLVLMDILMPGMNGMEATQEIRRKEKGSNRYLPIVALTANAMVGDRERYISQGMDGYISKPFAKKELLDTVAMAVKLREPY